MSFSKSVSTERKSKATKRQRVILFSIRISYRLSSDVERGDSRLADKTGYDFFFNSVEISLAVFFRFRTVTICWILIVFGRLDPTKNDYSCTVSGKYVRGKSLGIIIQQRMKNHINRYLFVNK